MPRFTSFERERIDEILKNEGERLFTQHGLKKVTVEDLASAAGIAKGSFYAFYSSKEHLFLEIAGLLQRKMWREMDDYLNGHRNLPPLELMKLCFMWTLSHLEQYPMLRQTDRETIEHLYRKLPPELIALHTQDDSDEVILLEKYGISFRCGIDMATKILQTLAVTFLSMPHEDPAQNTVIETILDGVLKEIILS